MTMRPENSVRADALPMFSSNRMRLTMGQWIVIISVMLPLISLASPAWKHFEEFAHPPDYRIPYPLSRDYWLYGQHVKQSVAEIPQPVFVVGDSIVWGEFVKRDATLPRFLGDQVDNQVVFVNAGVNGLFPLALEGLVRDYGDALHDQRVILHCNLLWMNSPEADLSSTKEQKFNHAELVPQFRPSIPCYRASVEERLSTAIARRSGFLSWSAHMQICYYGAKSIPLWTLDVQRSQPSGNVNAYALPWAPVSFRVPSELDEDADRGQQSPRHRPWFDRGLNIQSFEWVPPEDSLQWAAYQRLVALLLKRENDLLVVIGPFNKHLVSPSNRAGLQKWNETVASWLQDAQVPLIAPAALASEDYADASHPLTSGYRELARRVARDPVFKHWLSPRK